MLVLKILFVEPQRSDWRLLSSNSSLSGVIHGTKVLALYVSILIVYDLAKDISPRMGMTADT